MKAKFLVPLFVFLALAVFLGVGLRLNPRDVPSPLIDKPAPSFSLPRLDDPQKAWTPQEMLGRVWLLNVWASWCTPCRDEHPLLVEISKRGIVPIIGMNYKEARGAGGTEVRPDELEVSIQRASLWLRRFGNPYAATIMDVDGKVSIDYGVYGVPETYLIDQKGMIRFKHTGPLTPEVVGEKLLPKIAEVQSGK